MDAGPVGPVGPLVLIIRSAPLLCFTHNFPSAVLTTSSPVSKEEIRVALAAALTPTTLLALSLIRIMMVPVALVVPYKLFGPIHLKLH